MELHHVISRQGSRAKVVLGSARQANCKLIIGPGGPQRLPILCGNPLLKPPGLFSLLPWGRANDRTLFSGPSTGGHRWGDALAFLPQGGVDPPSSDNLFSRHLGGDPRPALAGDTGAEGEGFEPPRALARLPGGPAPSAGTSVPKRLDPKTRVIPPGRLLDWSYKDMQLGYGELPRRLLLSSP